MENLNTGDIGIRDRVNEILIDFDCENIEVTVENGEVSLLGEIPNEEMRETIEQKVKGLEGVQKIYNELHERSLPQ